MSRPALTTLALAAMLTLSAARSASAHFPWLATDEAGHALLFFGESPDDRLYHTPDAVAAAKVVRLAGRAAPIEVELDAVETGTYVGRKSPKPVPAGGVLESKIRYGIYHGMLLDYYAKHVSSLEGRPVVSTLKLDATPRSSDDGIEVVVNWDKQPLAEAAVTMIAPDGEQTEGKTDDTGIAKFKAPKAGLVGFLIVRMDPKATGEVDGEKYTSAGAYGTLTVNFGDGAAKPQAAESGADESAAVDALAPLPEALASFGAAVSDGWLYVYSGHVGEEHAHSKENLSQHFRRIKLNGGAAWEELPMEQPLQGLPLVAHGGKLYRAGGLSFRNAADEDPDMHSVADFACYDPATGKWTALAPLPEARSSHDAVVIGDTLYVLGGWTLAGESQGTWLDTAWSFDLTNPQGKWQAVAAPTFKRRALAVAAWNGQLVAIGGMDDDAKVSRRVDALDLASGQWSELPQLPRAQMAGFGVSAWNLDGKLLVSGADGRVHQLSDDGAAWQPVGELATGRFFHRLMPDAAGAVLAVAGASPEEGHLATIERFSPAKAN
jgi:hypothetical protein